MPFAPLRALISRDDDHDPGHEPLHDAPGVIPGEPEVGSPLQVFLESGAVMRTSPIQNVVRGDAMWVVETANSRYRVKLANAA